MRKTLQNKKLKSHLKRQIEFFNALSDETRQRLLMMLEGREMCVSDLVNAFNVAQPTISHHLSVLKHAGLVEDRKEGQQVFYSLDKAWLKSCCCDFLGMYECCSGFFKGGKKRRKKVKGE